MVPCLQALSCTISDMFFCILLDVVLLYSHSTSIQTLPKNIIAS